MVNDGLIDIAPEYQGTNSEGTHLGNQTLIESIFLGVPGLRCSWQTNPGQLMEVIDGVQKTLIPLLILCCRKRLLAERERIKKETPLPTWRTKVKMEVSLMGKGFQKLTAFITNSTFAKTVKNNNIMIKVMQIHKILDPFERFFKTPEA